MPPPPHRLPRLQARALCRVAVLGLLLLGAGCSSHSALLDCSGDGEVSGSFGETNSGALTFLHGLAWREPDGGYSVLFTDDPLLAEAGRVSPNPEYETELAARMLGALVVGYRFAPDLRYREHVTLGRSTSRGWSSADVGRIGVQDDGCVRGDVRVDTYGRGAFALPLTQPEEHGVLLSAAVEIDTRPEPAAPAEPDEAPQVEDAMAQWTAVHARLQSTDPTEALQALNFSPAVAARLAPDPRIAPVLARMRSQCPDPASARLDEYGDVVGASHPAPDIVLEGTALTSLSESGAFLRLCYAMQRNGESIEQCFPFEEDCSRAPAPGTDR